VYPAVATDRLPALVTTVGAVGVAAFALGLAGRWPWLLVWGPIGLGAEYGLFLRLRGGAVDARAPFLAAVLLLATELAFESIAADGTVPERALVLRHGLALAAAVAATAFGGGLLLVLGSSASAGLVLEAVGAAAAVAALALLVRVGARAPAAGPD